MDFEAVGRRLIQCRNDKGISQSAAAKQMGISQALLSNLERGMPRHTMPTMMLARYYGVNPHWLETGIGRPDLDINVVAAEIGTRRIPVVNYVQAGSFSCMGYDLDTSGLEYTQTDLDLSAYAFALEIRGKSMLPVFEEGDRVIIDCCVTPRAGDFVVAQNDSNEATFKKYRLLSTDPLLFELASLNPDYPAFRSDKHRYRIIGVMMEHRKPRPA